MGKLKKVKVLWVGYGAWMGIALGNMEDGHMGPKHSSRNITCFKGLGCLGIETHIGLVGET